MNNIKNICVYCASSAQIYPVYIKAAELLGQIMAQKSIGLINGAGKMGLMKHISDTVLAYGGTVTGIIPHFMVKQNWHHTGLTQLIETETMHERKSLMAKMSDAIIALPGGCGTMEELLEIITWKQLGLYAHPIVILNTNDFYTPLIGMLEKAIDEHFMRPEHKKLWIVATTPKEAIEQCCTLSPWNKNICKFAHL